jgi:hypothetical protein
MIITLTIMLSFGSDETWVHYICAVVQVMVESWSVCVVTKDTYAMSMCHHLPPWPSMYNLQMHLQELG